MFFFAVAPRCAFDSSDLKTGTSREAAIQALEQAGCRLLHVDIVSLARGLQGRSTYCRSAGMREAPDILDCSALIKWLYAQRGIWLPRYSVQQRKHGEEVSLEGLRAKDLVFATSLWNHNDPVMRDAVGHVGLAADGSHIIHASSEYGGVTECTVNDFMHGREFRGARRILSNPDSVCTFLTPPDLTIESSDDLDWIVSQAREDKK